MQCTRIQKPRFSLDHPVEFVRVSGADQIETPRRKEFSKCAPVVSVQERDLFPLTLDRAEVLPAGLTGSQDGLTDRTGRVRVS